LRTINSEVKRWRAIIYEFNFVSKDSKAVNKNNKNKQQITSNVYCNENIKNKSKKSKSKTIPLIACIRTLTNKKTLSHGPSHSLYS
jgi:hypothetical protein